MQNLDELYNKIKFSTILTTGRTGSDYLQTCLDNVPGILAFSGHFRFYNFYDNLKFDKFEEKKPLEILDIFIEKNVSLKEKFSDIYFYLKRVLYFYKLLFRLG